MITLNPSSHVFCLETEGYLPKDCVLEGIWKLQKIDKIRNIRIIYNSYKKIGNKQEIDDYLVSTVANDCSIMIALQSELKQNRIQIKTDFDCFTCSVGVIDLEKKPASKIDGHYQELLKSVAVYRNNCSVH